MKTYSVRLISVPIIFFFFYVAYVMWNRWDQAPFLPGDAVHSFDHWWYFQHRLRNGSLPQWNPYYLLGMPAVLWFKTGVSIFTPFLAFFSDFNPATFIWLHFLGYFLGTLSIFFMGRILGYNSYISLVPLGAMFMTWDFSHFTYWTVYLTYFIFFPLAIACLFSNRTIFYNNSLLRWFLFSLFLSLSFFGAKIELTIHTVGILILMFTVLAVYRHIKGTHSPIRLLLLGFGTTIIALTANAWHLLLVTHALVESVRTTGIHLANLIDPMFLKWIYISVVQNPEQFVLKTLVVNLIILLLLINKTLASKTLHWVLAMIVTVIELAALQFVISGDFSLSNIPLYNLTNALPPNELVCIGLAFILFFIQASMTLRNLIVFWIVVSAALYLTYLRTFYGPWDFEQLYFILFGGLGMFLERRTAILSTLVLYYFFNLTGVFFVYEGFGIIWLQGRDFPLLMPFLLIIFLEGVHFGIKSISLLLARYKGYWSWTTN